MAKRRTKKRTHVGASNPNSKALAAATTGHANIRDPKSMVIRIGAGEVGTSVSQLAADVRRVMEPGTASRLKERRANRLRDYVTMCGPLGVTHLMLFSRSESGNTNLRLAVTPRGPTLNFRVEQYSLAKDVRKAQRHPKGGGKEFITPPLLVMNNFTNPSSDSSSKVPKHLESLTTTVFQSLFPPINPTTTPLKSIRRVLLLNREQSKEDDGSFILNFRHYAITTKVTGISRPLRRLNAAEKLLNSKKSKKGNLPNLSKLQDIADYMIGGENGEGYMTDATSGSEVETDAEVEVLESAPRKVLSAKARAAAAVGEEEPSRKHEELEANIERRAVKLVELGPRMKLRLTKVEEGLCSGKVMWHEYVHKTPQEIKELEKRWEQRRQEKEARKKEQRENVEKKRKAKADAKGNGKGGDEGEDDEMDYDDVDSDFYDYMDVDGGGEDFDSEGLEGDAETQVNEKMEDKGEWEDEEDEIAAG
ncbi:Ribosome biogenesis protein SSF1 [Pleurostoma richardsiae]|uniref:Ribosome biogenesis protein SSF1 n=1 Tax=Pleurostoma richardsiae TaxID=41990 RepID=A0AA38R8J5_9PEZI|nr:Ribosome biogenesis protein SSF1 [Pleurostoma richardsiae]